MELPCRVYVDGDQVRFWSESIDADGYRYGARFDMPADGVPMNLVKRAVRTICRQMAKADHGAPIGTRLMFSSDLPWDHANEWLARQALTITDGRVVATDGRASPSDRFVAWTESVEA